jgi:hypothetical protein
MSSLPGRSHRNADNLFCSMKLKGDIVITYITLIYPRECIAAISNIAKFARQYLRRKRFLIMCKIFVNRNKHCQKYLTSVTLKVLENQPHLYCDAYTRCWATTQYTRSREHKTTRAVFCGSCYSSLKGNEPINAYS